jgi:hypothetical protein
VRAPLPISKYSALAKWARWIFSEILFEMTMKRLGSRGRAAWWGLCVRGRINERTHIFP